MTDEPRYNLRSKSTLKVSVISTSKIGGENTKWMWMLLCIIILCNFSLGDKLTVQDSKNTKLYYHEESTYIVIYFDYVRKNNQSVDLLLLHQESTIRERKLDAVRYLVNFTRLQMDTEYMLRENGYKVCEYT